MISFIVVSLIVYAASFISSLTGILYLIRRGGGWVERTGSWPLTFLTVLPIVNSITAVIVLKERAEL